MSDLTDAMFEMFQLQWERRMEEEYYELDDRWFSEQDDYGWYDWSTDAG